MACIPGESIVIEAACAIADERRIASAALIRQSAAARGILRDFSKNIRVLLSTLIADDFSFIGPPWDKPLGGIFLLSSGENPEGILKFSERGLRGTLAF
jgi:hypothetical protein